MKILKTQRNNKVGKQSTPYLNPSDIVNSAGNSYIVKEKEMESSINMVLNEINHH